MSSHEISIGVTKGMSIEELLIFAVQKCVLPDISGGMGTWFTYVESELKKYLGVLAQQWKNTKLLVNSATTVGVIYSKEQTKLIFRYWCQAGPDLVFKSLANNIVKYIPTEKSATSIGLATRCFASRLQWRYAVAIFQH